MEISNRKIKIKKISINIRDYDNKPGAEPKISFIKIDLLSYIKLCRGIEISIGTKEIIIKAYKLMPELWELSYSWIHSWVNRFLKRYI